MPGTRKSWTYAYLLERMREDIGWAPHHPNYSKYETGKQSPEPETLDKFVAFWAGHGIDTPDFDAVPAEPEPEPSLAAALFAIAGELRAAREERAAVTRRLDEIEAVLRVHFAQAMQGTGEHPVQRETAGSSQ